MEFPNCLAEYEFARLASEQSGKKYTVFGISQKLARNSIKYDEMKFFAKVLGHCHAELVSASQIEHVSQAQGLLYLRP